MPSNHVMFHSGTEKDCEVAKPKVRDGKEEHPVKLMAEKKMPPMDKKESRPKKEKILSPKKSGME